MSSARYLVGDVRQALRTLPDNSVDLVLTSPPFLALRSYLPADHPDKQLEMGSEPTPGEFIDALLDVVEECRRVLAPHGSVCIELGDTYSGSGGAGGDYNNAGLRAGQEKFDGSAARGRAQDREYDGGASDRWDFAKPGTKSRLASGDGWPTDKSLCLIPESFRWALAYGRNPFTGRQTPPWRVRNVVRWCRPNPPVGALGDKVRPATSDMVIACTARDRYFDLDAVRQPGSTNTHARTAKGVPSRRSTGKAADDAHRGGNFSTLDTLHDSDGAPPLDHWWHDDVFEQDAWLISTQPYAGSHYATFPEALCVRPVKAMCLLKVCTVCGQPSRRITTAEYERDERGGTNGKRRDLTNPEGHEHGMREAFSGEVMAKVVHTVGWTDCGCAGGDARWRTGVVLDPFAGSGTTLAVATGHGRDAIGIDLDARNADLALERVGPMFLTVEDLGDAAA